MLSKLLRRADDARGMVNKRLKRRRCMGLAAAAIKCEWSTGFTFKVATQAQSRDANAQFCGRARAALCRLTES